mmetsp:Transcript_26927/g.45234  ORF Transcript_26927/g.45234 Transcript_26927/m.45234 type:complete len:1697 (+) Transcript_26927:766-5856(+)
MEFLQDLIFQHNCPAGSTQLAVAEPFILNSPNFSVQPTVSLSYPSVSDNCQEIFITSVNSRGSACRPFSSYEWTLLPTTSYELTQLPVPDVLLTEISTLILDNTSPSLTFFAPIPGVRYDISVKLTNWLGGTAMRIASVTASLTGYRVPHLTINTGDNVFIDFTRNSEFTTSLLPPSVFSSPECSILLSFGQVVYNWELIDGPMPLPLLTGNTNGPALRLPSFFFKPFSTYTIMLNATFNPPPPPGGGGGGQMDPPPPPDGSAGGGGMNPPPPPPPPFESRTTTTFVNIITGNETTDVRLEGCNRHLPLPPANQFRVFTISARTSRLRAPNGLVTQDELEYELLCSDGVLMTDNAPPGTMLCQVGNPPPGITFPPARKGEIVFSNEGLEDLNSQDDAFYRLTANVWYPPLAGSLGTGQCIIIPSSAVNIDVEVDVVPNFINSNIRFSAIFPLGPSPQNATYSWTCRKGPSRIPCESSAYAGLSNAELTSRTLRIPFSNLQPSIVYIWSVLVSPSPSSQGIAFAEYKVPQLPQGGVCEAVPAISFAYNTSIRLQCHGWSTGALEESLPLSYQFSLIQNSGLSTVLCRFSPSAECSAALPGEEQPGQSIVSLIASIRIGELRTLQVPFQVTIITPMLDAASAQILADTLEEDGRISAELGELDVTVQQLSAAAGLYRGRNDLGDRRQQTRGLIDIARTAVDRAERTSASVVSSASIFALLVSEQETVDPDLAADVADVSANLSLGIAADSELAYSDEYGQQTTALLASIMNITGGNFTPSYISTATSQSTNILSSFRSDMALRNLGLAMAPEEGVLISASSSEDAGGFYCTAEGLSPEDALEILQRNSGFSVSPSAFTTDAGSPINSTITSILAEGPRYWPPASTEDVLPTITSLISLRFFDSEMNEILVSDLNPSDEIQVVLGVDEMYTPDAEEVAATEYGCRFYDEVNFRWSVEGCSVGVYDERNRTITCFCNHLTSFEGFTAPNINRISEADINNLTIANIGRNPFTLMLLLFVWCVYAVLLVLARRLNERRISKLKHDPNIELDEFVTQWYHQFIHNEIEKEVSRMEDSDQDTKNSDRSIAPLQQPNEGADQMSEVGRVSRVPTPIGSVGSFQEPVVGSGQSEQRLRRKIRLVSSIGGKSSMRRPGHRSTKSTVSWAADLESAANGKEAVRGEDTIEEETKSYEEKKTLRSLSIDLDDLALRVDSRRQLRLEKIRLYRASSDKDFVDSKEGKDHKNTNNSRSNHSVPCSSRSMPDGTSDIVSPESTSSGAFSISSMCIPQCKPKHPQLKRLEDEQYEEKSHVIKRLKASLIDRQHALKLERKRRRRRRRKRGKMPQIIEEKPRVGCSTVKKLWKTKMKNKHAWVSVLAHHRRDPFQAQWRANVLLQSLLMISVVNGLFYGVPNSQPTLIVTAIASAIVVTLIDVIFVLAAKKIGKYKWEIRMCELRQQLCRRITPKEMSNSTVMKNGKHMASEMAPAAEAKNSSALDSRVEIRGKLNATSGKIEDEKGRGEIEKLKSRERLIAAIAWSCFLIIALGCSFIVLVLGVRFDLNDDSNEGIEVHNSASFRWLISTILSEVLRACLALPIVFAIMAVVVYFIVLFAPTIMQEIAIAWVISEDDLYELKAYDVFERVNDGFTLNAEGMRRLRILVRRATDIECLKSAGSRNANNPKPSGTRNGSVSSKATGIDRVLRVD